MCQQQFEAEVTAQLEIEHGQHGIVAQRPRNRPGSGQTDHRKPYQEQPQVYWLIQRATETFYPWAGMGRGSEARELFRMTETDVMHSAVVRVWYMRDASDARLSNGPDKACYMTGKEKLWLTRTRAKEHH